MSTETVIDSWTVTWSVLPNGYAPDTGRTRLSLVASPRVSTATGLLRDSEVARWPAIVAALPPLQVIVAGTDDHFPATVVSPPPDQRLWDALFGPNTPVDLTEQEGPIFMPVTTSLHYRPALEAVERLYARALADSPTELLRADHPVARTVAALAEWSFDEQVPVPSAAPSGVQDALRRMLDPATLTSDRIDDAAQLLRENDLTRAADVLPLALVVHRLRAATAAAGPATTGPAATDAAVPGHPQQPSHLAGIKRLDQADFHQVIGLVSDHPALALALGLRVDLEVAPLDGDLTLRVVQPQDLPLHHQHAANQPWSRIIADKGARRVTMAPRPGGHVRNGLVDLSPQPGKYVTTTQDLAGQAAALASMAQVLAGPNPPQTAGLPPRRNTGIVLAQVDRITTMVQPALVRAGELAHDLGVPVGDVVLLADDVTQGYRVDVSDNGGPFRSLMRREVRYQLPAGGKLPPFAVATSDEGFLDAGTVAEQYHPDGTPALLAGEEVAGWHNWSLAAPMPGRRVTGERAGQPPVTDGPLSGALEQIGPGYPLSMRIEATPGTLPRLRYGHRYRFRLRAVDLAGNSVDLGVCDPTLVSPDVPYLRLDPVRPPVLVPRRPFTGGESLTRLVVRSDGNGNPLGNPCERHLAAPKSSQHMAELHGEFDTAFGPDTPARAAARELMLAVGRIEEGAFTDPTVPDPADPTRRIPAPGIRVAVNEGSGTTPAGTLPLPRGGALPAGEYVVHETDDPNLPYLPDSAAAGVAVTGLPGIPGKQVSQVDYPGSAWPDVRPVRLVAKAGATGGTTVRPSASGRPVVEVTVPPAAEVRVQLSSTVLPRLLPAFDVAGTVPDAAALAGQVPLLSPADTITLVHAVQTPLPPLAVTAAATPPDRPVGSTTAEVSGTLTCHPDSTGRIDIEAVWQEVTDTGSGPVRTEQRNVTTEQVTVPAGTATLPWSVRHTLGDTLRRDITYRPLGITRFREYFEPLPPGQALPVRTGTGVVVQVPNAGRPAPPRVHSIVPTFGWERSLAAGVLTSTRLPAGVRVYLDRPWLTTGTGERLGVVVYHTTGQGNAAVLNGRPLRQLVTRWATDPLESTGTGAPPLVAANLPAGLEVGAGLPLVERNATVGDTAGSIDIVGHEVHHDPDRDLWYADVDLAFLDDRFPFLRLALVRYQPVSVPGCHVSRVVLTDFFQLPPRRDVSVRLTPDQTALTVELHGHPLRNTVCTAQLVLRNTNTGSVDGALVHFETFGPSVAHEVTLTPLGGLPTGLLPLTGPLTHPLGDWDVVVREFQEGDHLHSTTPARRCVFVEVVEGSRLATCSEQPPSAQPRQPASVSTFWISASTRTGSSRSMLCPPSSTTWTGCELPCSQTRCSSKCGAD